MTTTQTVMVANKHWTSKIASPWDFSWEYDEPKQQAEVWAADSGHTLLQFWFDNEAGGYFAEAQ